MWAAASPGAGFAESAQYLKIKTTSDAAPPWWEQKLWHYYDAVDYAANLFNLPTIEYHGEIDPQQQAGDLMAHAMAEEGMRLVRVVGPQTADKFHPDSKIELERMLDEIAARGRDATPRKVRFTTYTLTYNKSGWVTVDALGKHWESARVDAEVTGDSTVKVATANVAAFTLAMGSGACPLAMARPTVVTIHGEKVAAAVAGVDRSCAAHCR